MRWISRYNSAHLKSVFSFVSSLELCKSEYFLYSHMEVLQCGLSANWPCKTIKQSNKALWWILASSPWLDAVRMSSGISILALLVFSITVFKNEWPWCGTSFYILISLTLPWKHLKENTLSIILDIAQSVEMLHEVREIGVILRGAAG